VLVQTTRHLVAYKSGHCGNIPGFDPVEQVGKQWPGKVAALNAGHG